MDDKLIKRMDILDRRLKEIGEIQQDILKVRIATAVMEFSSMGIAPEKSPYARDVKELAKKYNLGVV